MKKFILFVFIISGIFFNIYSQYLNGRISSSLYTFERLDSVDSGTKYLRSFETLNLNYYNSQFAFHSSFNFESELTGDVKDISRLRFYHLYIEGRNLLDLLTIKLGRQPIFNSIAGGLFDGINVQLNKNDFKVSGYYGLNTPPYQKLEVTDDASNNYLFGGEISTSVLSDFNISLSYINKHFKTLSYFANRLSPNLTPITVLIENESQQYEFASAKVSYDLKDIISINTRYDYDFNFERTSKAEIYASYNQIKNLSINAYFNYREPRVRYNSIFAVFDFGNTREFEVGADYNFDNNYSVSGKFGNVNYHGENAQRLSLGLSSSVGSINYRKTFGYAGELDAVSVYLAHSILKGLLTPSLGVSYTSYKLSEDDQTNDLTTVLAGFNYRPFTLLSFDVQGQYMNNKIYKNDYRFFLKINYWFNSKL